LHEEHILQVTRSWVGREGVDMKDEGMDVKGEDMDTCIKVRVWT